MKIYKQETSKSCGIACLRSIINHFGNDYTEKQIWDKHDTYRMGQDGDILNPVLNLGVTALRFGLDVTYVGYNPIIFSNNSSKDLRKGLNDKSKKYFGFGRYLINEALKFINLDGRIKIDKLNVKKIKKIIDKDKFVLVEIKPVYLHGKGQINMNHKVIINGYTKKGFKVLDPSDGKETIWDYNTFLLSFYAAIPELLIIKPKRYRV